MSMKTIGERIKKIRTEMKVPQKEVALVIDVQRPNYSKIENNKQNLTPEQLKRLCEYFNVSADYILDIHIDNKRTLTDYDYENLHRAMKTIKETIK